MKPVPLKVKTTFFQNNPNSKNSLQSAIIDKFLYSKEASVQSIYGNNHKKNQRENMF